MNQGGTVKKILSFAAGIALVGGLSVGTPRAQLGEIVAQNISTISTNPFGCATACTSGGAEQTCNLWNRVYGDKGPAVGINSPAILTNPCEKDGYPRYGSTASRMFGDGHTTANYPTINATTDACEAWYSVFDGATTPDTALFISYYGAGGTIVNFGENGNRNCPDCGTTCGLGTTVAAGACIGGLTNSTIPGGTSTVSATNTPQGELLPIGGLSPVPVPRVTASDVGANTLSLAWGAASNQTNVNRPSSSATACPGGSTFNDLSATTGPPAIRGVRLFVHTEPGTGAARTLASLEGASLVGTTLQNLGNTRNSICFNAATCPGSHIIRCADVTGGVCVGDGTEFSVAAQAITLTETAVNAALGTDGPIGGGPGKESIVFNVKLVYAGATVTSSTAGNSSLSPKLVSLFGANSAKTGFGGLVSGVQFDSSATKLQGNRVTVSWTAVGSFTSFQLSRSFDSVNFSDLATIGATGAPSYSFTDELRGRTSAKVYYRVVALASDGSQTQALTEVSLRGRR